MKHLLRELVLKLQKKEESSIDLDQMNMLKLINDINDYDSNNELPLINKPKNEKFLLENIKERLRKQIFYDALDADNDQHESTVYIEFNSDTKLSALGGLSVWEFTAVCILILICLAVLIWTAKKIYILTKSKNIFQNQRESNYIKSNVCDTSYSTESCDTLITIPQIIKHDDENLWNPLSESV